MNHNQKISHMEKKYINENIFITNTFRHQKTNTNFAGTNLLLKTFKAPN